MNLAEHPEDGSTGTVPPTVSVVVPSLNRHGPLERALLSLLAQILPPGHGAEIVVVDNSAEANARPLVERLAEGAAVPIRYVSMPQPGIASARNAGVAAAKGDWIAFLDDDETAAPGWLGALLTTARRGGVDAVFGPVVARAEDGSGIGPFAAYFARDITAEDGADITHLAAYLGTNNSLFAAGVCAVPGGPFEERLNHIGGEDSLFLKRLALDGRRFAWAAGAEVTEWVPRRRLDWDYVRRRRFLSGQIRTFVHEMIRPRRRLAVVGWMGIGLVQAVLAGSLSLVLRPFHAPAARHQAIKAWGGLGKVFWMSRFRGSLYGHGLVS